MLDMVTKSVTSSDNSRHEVSRKCAIAGRVGVGMTTAVPLVKETRK